MPPTEYSGCGEPSGGARPSAFRSGLEGPDICTQASAVTCGGIIIGSTKRKPSGPLPGISVSVNTKAKSAPMTSEISVPHRAVTSVYQVADQSARSVRTDTAPPSANAKIPVSASRTSGNTLSRTTTPTMNGNSQAGWLLLGRT